MTRTTLAVLPLVLLLGCSKDAVPPSAPTSTTATPVDAPPPAPEGAAATPAATPPATLAAPAPAAAAAELTAGQAAPDFTTSDQNGKAVHLADLKGKWVVVYFYPKDETPGCTHEACSFRDAWTNLQKKGVVIIGVSSDTQASHKAFAEHHKLPFVLVSDSDGAIAAKYGVPVQEGYEKRESFVVSPDGKVKKVYRTVDVKVHAAEILADTSS